MQISNAFLQIIQRARVARFSTIDYKENMPHTVPVVFAFDDTYYYIPIDKKNKRQSVEKLKRIKNLQHNSNVALLIDEYSEDWTELVFVMIQGKAYLLGQEKELEDKGNNNDVNNPSLKEIHKLLYKKYPQYKEVGIGQYCIMIQPQKIISWKNK